MANNATQKGIDVVIKAGERILAGQLGARLNQSASPIDITNKINGEWKEYIGGLKSWSIECNGLYVKNADTYNVLQEAFRNNTTIDTEVILDGHRYTGKALLVEFPLTAAYNDTYKYNVRLLGDGALNISE